MLRHVLVVLGGLAGVRCLAVSDSGDSRPKVGTGGSHSGSHIVGDGSFPTRGPSDAGTDASDTATSDGAGGTAGAATGGLGGSGGGCAPTSCVAANAQCGSLSDGCGNMLDCGACGSFQFCSAAHACAPLAGEWLFLGDQCGMSLMDASVQEKFLFGAGNVFQFIGSDSDCLFFHNGVYTLNPPNSIHIQINSATCSPNGCPYGSSQSMCLSVTYSVPGQIDGAIVFVDANTITLTLPPSTSPACPPASARIITLTRNPPA